MGDGGQDGKKWAIWQRRRSDPAFKKSWPGHAEDAGSHGSAHAATDGWGTKHDEDDERVREDGEHGWHDGGLRRHRSKPASEHAEDDGQDEEKMIGRKQFRPHVGSCAMWCTDGAQTLSAPRYRRHCRSV